MNESDSSKWTARWPDEWHGASDPNATVRCVGGQKIAVALATSPNQGCMGSAVGDILLRVLDTDNRITHVRLSRGNAWELARKLKALYEQEES